MRSPPPLLFLCKEGNPAVSFTACPYISYVETPVTSEVTGKKPCLYYGIAIAVGRFSPGCEIPVFQTYEL